MNYCNIITGQIAVFLLDNPFYHGMMQVKGKLYPHKYPPLITESLFNQVQKVKHGANKSNARHAGKKDILLRGLMKCNCCGCQITGDIKKNKYVYYSCTNGKGICKKECVREEELLSPMLEYLDKIKISDDLIEKIVDYLKKSFEAEQEFYKQTHENLRKELDQVQNRISRLVDSHLDGKIDGDIYEKKLNEYKKRQQEITFLMAAHVDADKASLITVKTVLDLAKRAKEIYESSKVDEKRQILNFLFSNLEMKDKKAIITLREPFDRLIAVSDHPMCRKGWDSNPRYGISVHTLSKRAP
jgi:site-specific DNA recombinase